MTYPLVSVVTAGYNAEKYLLDSINSVLNQTYTNIEYIYVDDGSEDESVKLIKQNIRDDRFLLLRNEKNIGPFNSLNKGLMKAKGKYIAILDADDISLPFRIEKQVNALEINVNANVCGTGFEIINEQGVLQSIKELNYGDFECKYRMQFNNIVAHSSVMYRAEAFDSGAFYSAKYGISEDYELLLKLLQLSNIAVIQTPCIKYRISKSGLTRTKKEEMDRVQYEIVKEHYSVYHNIDITAGMYVNSISKPTSIKYLIQMLKIRKDVYNSITRKTKRKASKYICYRNQLENVAKVTRYSLVKFKNAIMKRIK